MKQIKEEIYDLLKVDATLLNYLGSNKPFNNPSGASAKINSIIPAGKAKGAMAMPIITIAGGPESRLSNRFYTSVVYVRVYGSAEKTFVTIDNVVQRIIDLLHLKPLGLTNGVAVKMVRESVSGELLDEGLKLNFKEITMRIYML